MTDVENLEKIIFDIFAVKKIIKNKKNSNDCISPLNKTGKNLFAYNFLNRLYRLNKRFSSNPDEINEICEKIKNLGEAHNSQWAGPYSELVALDFFSQFNFGVNYINILDINKHKNSIPFRMGQKEVIDIDICLSTKKTRIYTDVKSFNCIHTNIFDEIFQKVESFAFSRLGKSVLRGVDNLSSIDYVDVKNHLGVKKKIIERNLKSAVERNLRTLIFESDGLRFKFRIEYSDTISTVKEFSPFEQAQAYKFKFIDYGNKLIDNEYSLITMVKNPWFNKETVDFGNFNNLFYRSLARRTFMELLKIRRKAGVFSHGYFSSDISVREISRSIAGIIFIDDNSFSTKATEELYSAYIYLNPNYKNKPPLTIRILEKYFRNELEVQIKDFDDFKWDNY